MCGKDAIYRIEHLLLKELIYYIFKKNHSIALIVLFIDKSLPLRVWLLVNIITFRNFSAMSS